LLNVLISFWEVNLRQLKLDFAKDSKSGKADGTSTELFTTAMKGKRQRQMIEKN